MLTSKESAVRMSLLKFLVNRQFFTKIVLKGTTTNTLTAQNFQFHGRDFKAD
jgi:hypothetical protein